jgi:capsular polysaccharide biosynthesis protein
MFRRKQPQQPKLSPEEERRLLANVTGQPQTFQPVPPQQIPVQQPMAQPVYTQARQQPQHTTATKYYISKKDFLRERQSMVTQSGQIIETGQEITREVSNDIHQITKEDLVAIIKGVDETKSIHQLALKMLTNEL